MRASQLARSAAGEAFFTERGKTGKPVGGLLSLRAMTVLTAYLEKLGVELHGDAYIFRNRSGAPYSSDTLGDDFRDVRAVEFGPLERRTIGHDFRRTGAVEAITGGAKAEQVAHAMGNTLSASNALFATYVPVNVTTLRDVTAARRAGAPEAAMRTKLVQKVGTRRSVESERAEPDLISNPDRMQIQFVDGGSDGARTRDLRRDRPAVYLGKSKTAPTFRCPKASRNPFIVGTPAEPSRCPSW